jgi:prepilin-type processing-associated H-X9-DG protein
MLDDVPDPARTILMREKEAFPVSGREGLSRTYLFADGHSEIHLAPDGDFTAWEQERGVKSGP